MRAPVSVIVPVRNAAPVLAEQLRALCRQDRGVVREILVADNGSTDGSRAVASAASRSDARIRVLDASTRRGAAHARNVAARRATGVLLAFCDADDVVSPGWAAALWRCAATGRASFLAGRNDHDYFDARADGPPRRWPVSIHPAPSAAGPGSAGSAVGEVRFAEGCNMAVTRAAFDAAGGFDESLTLAAEDAEFSARLVAAGYPLTFCPEAVVHYRDRRTVRAAARQAYRYGRGNRLFLSRTGRQAATCWTALGRAGAEAARAVAAAGSIGGYATHLRRASFWTGFAVSALRPTRNG